MAFYPGQKLSTNVDELEGVVKAAIILLSLPHEVAGALLKQLSTEQVEDVTRTLASLGEVPADISERVVEEFYTLRMASLYMKEGGLDYAKALLKDSLDPKLADRVIQQIISQLHKLVDVIEVTDLTQQSHVERELAIIKVDCAGPKRGEIIQIVDIFRARIVDVNLKTVMVELVGSKQKIDGLIDLLDEFGILELTRTGRIAQPRGVLDTDSID